MKNEIIKRLTYCTTIMSLLMWASRMVKEGLSDEEQVELIDPINALAFKLKDHGKECLDQLGFNK